jgi:membrane protein implicated in regulation of membrane protease activity
MLGANRRRRQRARGKPWEVQERDDGLVDVRIGGKALWDALVPGEAARRVKRQRHPGDKVVLVALDGYRLDVTKAY